jgi:hypothetical protein
MVSLLEHARDEDAVSQTKLQHIVSSSATRLSGEIAEARKQLVLSGQANQTSHTRAITRLEERLGENLTHSVGALQTILTRSLDSTEVRLKDISSSLYDIGLKVGSRRLAAGERKWVQASQLLDRQCTPTSVTCAAGATIEEVDWDYAYLVFRLILHQGYRCAVSSAQSLFSFLSKIIQAWPQILLILQALYDITRAPSQLLSDNIRFEDVLGRVQSLPFRYFQHREVFLETLACIFSGSPAMERIAQGKFKIWNRNMCAVTNVNWEELVQPRSRLAMSVDVEYIRVYRRRCPSLACSGRLKAITSSMSECRKCQKVLINQQPPLQAKAIPDTTTESSGYLAGELGSGPTAPSKMEALCDSVALPASHAKFQALRSRLAAEFVSFCAQKTKDFQTLEDMFARKRDISWNPLLHSLTIGRRSDRNRHSESDLERFSAHSGRRMLHTSAQLAIEMGGVALACQQEARARKSVAEKRRIGSEIEKEEIMPYRRINAQVETRHHTVSELLTEGETKLLVGTIGDNIDIEELDEDGNSPLGIAIFAGNSMMVDFLLELGADPLIPSNGHTDMLQAAVVYGYNSILFSLLTKLISCIELDAALKEPPLPHGRPTEVLHEALATATAQRRLLEVELLLFFGADPFSVGPSQSPLHDTAYGIALRQAETDIIASFLLKAISVKYLDLIEVRAIMNSIFDGTTSRLRNLITSSHQRSQFLYLSYVILSGAVVAPCSCESLDSYESRPITYMPPTTAIGRLWIQQSADLTLDTSWDIVCTYCHDFFAQGQMRHWTEASEAMAVVRNISAMIAKVRRYSRARYSNRLNTDQFFDNLQSGNWFKRILELRMLIYGVNSDMANPSSAYLDDTEYWRLRDDGFRNVRECLGDLQNIVWKCVQDMQPFWDAASVAQQKGHRGRFLYRFGQHRCLNPKNCAVLSFKITDDGIEVRKWLHDMADLDLQCVVPMAVKLREQAARF